ncbi:hypothetical protein Tco_0755759 [Tanacetum coccineum]
MEANGDGQDSAKKKLNFKVKHIDSDIQDDSVRKRLCFAKVAVRYAAEPQPLPSAKPKAKPQAVPKAMTQAMPSAQPNAMPDAKISKYQMHSLRQK